MNKQFDIAIIGGGHSGIEAAYAAAKFGLKIALITQNIKAIGRLSCNPAIGGIGKSHVVKEVDALGGLMGRIADETAIQFRTLNLRKGAAVRATRSQNDRNAYPFAVQRELLKIENITLIEDEVSAIDIRKGAICSVKLTSGVFLAIKAAVIATGTFLDGKIFIGEELLPAGRIGETPSKALSICLKSHGITLKRFKTGTPPRIHASSVDFLKLIKQPGEENYRPFSILSEKRLPVSMQLPCWATRTNDYTHEIIRRNLSKSPLFNSRITGTGPRYCPSIEIKLIRFPDNHSHTIFLEPEGRDNPELYVNGFSMSLPRSVQLEAIRSIEGLSHCEITKWAYAVEYDSIDPRQLNSDLSFNGIEGLYFAGQINGTSGYEEAAGQGILAGINAALRLRDGEPLILKREESYIGVMVDDLTTFGADEPYRLFTSRSEHRLKLREDNAIWRLLEYSACWNLLPAVIIDKYREYEDIYQSALSRFNEELVPDELRRFVSPPHRPTLLNCLKHPDCGIEDFANSNIFSGIPDVVLERIEIETKYRGFIAREDKRAESYSRLLSEKIPIDIDYSEIDGLSSESKEKLIRNRPSSLREASAISGVTPSAILAIHIYLQKKVSHETSS